MRRQKTRDITLDILTVIFILLSILGLLTLAKT